MPQTQRFVLFEVADPAASYTVTVALLLGAMDIFADALLERVGTDVSLSTV